jgi:hypothetical protein
MPAAPRWRTWTDDDGHAQRRTSGFSLAACAAVVGVPALGASAEDAATVQVLPTATPTVRPGRHRCPRGPPRRRRPVAHRHSHHDEAADPVATVTAVATRCLPPAEARAQSGTQRDRNQWRPAQTRRRHGDAGGIGGTDGTGGVSGGGPAPRTAPAAWGGAHPHPAASCAKRLVLSLGVATVAPVGPTPRRWTASHRHRARWTALVVAGAEPQLALAAQQAARSSISKPTTPYAAFRGAARDSG